MPDWIQVKDALVEVALEAGKLILEKSGSVAFDDKLNAVDLVTAIDKQVEIMTKERLVQAYPSFRFIGEETYVPGQTVLTDDPTFIVDPIDGTTNFVHNFPFACISLGVAYEKKPVVGVVYNPFLNRLFWGVKGHGSYLNDQKLPLRTPQPLKLQGSVIALEWGNEREGHNFAVKLKTNENMVKKEGGAFVQGVRSLGSAAMNLCHVAAGSLDCYQEGGCWAWDVCAGWVILEEAGGMMVSANKGNWTPELDSRLYFGVRGGESQKEFIEEYWSHLGGDLVY